MHYQDDDSQYTDGRPVRTKAIRVRTQSWDAKSQRREQDKYRTQQRANQRADKLALTSEVNEDE